MFNLDTSKPTSGHSEYMSDKMIRRVNPIAIRKSFLSEQKFNGSQLKFFRKKINLENIQLKSIFSRRFSLKKA